MTSPPPLRCGSALAPGPGRLCTPPGSGLDDGVGRTGAAEHPEYTWDALGKVSGEGQLFRLKSGKVGTTVLSWSAGYAAPGMGAVFFLSKCIF